MIFFVALIPATGLTVAGYVALFLSHRSEGGLRTFGRYLGIWAFVLAGLVVIGGGFAAGHMRAYGGMWGPHGGMDGPPGGWWGQQGGMWGPHEGMYCPWMERRDGDRMWDRRERPETGAAPGKAGAAEPEAPGPGAKPNPAPPSR